MSKLYNIFYNGRYDAFHNQTPQPYYEATTNNIKKWLEEHNKDRVEEGNEPECAEEFDVELIHPFLYEEVAWCQNLNK